jgi:hypothetical protein
VAGRYYVDNGLHRVDIPDPTDPERYRTEWYGTAAIFRITPVDELTARAVAKQSVIPDAIPWDVSRELKQLVAPSETIEQQDDGYWPGVDEDEPDGDRDDDEDEAELCGCSYCVCHNHTIAGEVCSECLAGAHQG